MTTKTFTFGQTCDKDNLSVSILEERGVPYGLHVWPCGLVMARYLWKNCSRIRNQHILELGAGCALPGIVAAKLGGHVTLSDALHLNEARQRAVHSCQLNQLSDLPVLPLTWGEFHPAIFSLARLDIILGADCFYDSKDFQDILVTVAFLLKRHPSAEFWTTYQQRSPSRRIDDLVAKWGLHVEYVDVEGLKYPDAPETEVAAGLDSVCFIKMRLAHDCLT